MTCGEHQRTQAEFCANAIEFELIEHARGPYNERARVLAMACKMAIVLGYRVGLGRHPDHEPWEDDWRTIVFLDLPTSKPPPDDRAQASWHIHDSERPLFDFLGAYESGPWKTPGVWDGHTTEDKYRRLEAFGAMAISELAALSFGSVREKAHP